MGADVMSIGRLVGFVDRDKLHKAFGTYGFNNRRLCALKMYCVHVCTTRSLEPNFESVVEMQYKVRWGDSGPLDSRRTAQVCVDPVPHSCTDTRASCRIGEESRYELQTSIHL